MHRDSHAFPNPFEGCYSGPSFPSEIRENEQRTAIYPPRRIRRTSARKDAVCNIRWEKYFLPAAPCA